MSAVDFPIRLGRQQAMIAVPAARRLGWGIRLVQAMMLGCIPVIIQPGVHQYYQDFLPYRK